MALVVQDLGTLSALENCTAIVQNASSDVAHLVDKVAGLEHTIFYLVASIGILLLFASFLWIYFFIRRRFAYKIIIFKHNSWQILYTYKLANIIEVKHSKGDKFNYVVDNKCIYAGTLMYFWHNPKPVMMSPENNIPTALDLSLNTLKRSTVIEKFITMDDFMGLIKILLIVIIVLSLIGAFVGYMGYSKEMVCNLIIENRTALTSIVGV